MITDNVLAVIKDIMVLTVAAMDTMDRTVCYVPHTVEAEVVMTQESACHVMLDTMVHSVCQHAPLAAVTQAVIHTVNVIYVTWDIMDCSVIQYAQLIAIG